MDATRAAHKSRESKEKTVKFESVLDVCLNWNNKIGSFVSNGISLVIFTESLIPSFCWKFKVSLEGNSI